MAARSGSHSSQVASSSPSGACILDLPHEVLVKCLGLLELKPRLRLALVCKQFAAAACSPELLQEVDVGTVRGLPAVQSLTAWLARHGRHVRRLTTHFWEAAAEVEEETAAKAACLTTAGAAGQLVELCESSKLPHTKWLAAMRSLQRLLLTAPAWDDNMSMHVSPAISGLTVLQSLHLQGLMFVFQAGARLPAGITRLKLSDQGSDLEEELPGVARLELSNIYNRRPDALSVLSRLSGSLTRLDVFEAGVPSTLSALTWLQHLQLIPDEPDDATHAITAAAQPQLTQLTCLVLDMEGEELLTSVASLPNLQRCCEITSSYHDEPLPAGPWLHSLRWLGTEVDSLVDSLPVLHAASSLEVLDVQYTLHLDWNSPDAAALLDWLAQHPPLRRICFNQFYCCAVVNPTALEAAIAQLARRRPGLQVQCYDEVKQSKSMFQQLLDEDCP